jgi:alpha-tubulin suppressor-like RCC1 family protein
MAAIPPILKTSGLQNANFAWTWGDGADGQLGNNTAGFPNASSFPVMAAGGHKFISIAVGGGVGYMMGLKTDGSVWSWGNNQHSQLGHNAFTTFVPTSSPIVVICPVSLSKISGGTEHAGGIASSDGSIWMWGRNGWGELGRNNGVLTSESPAQIAGVHSFIQISLGYRFSVALKADGTVWAWGLNSSGQLGDGTTTNRSSPVQVIGPDLFTYVAAGDNAVVALKADGTAFAWGLNDFGQLGNNTTTNRSSPVQVAGGPYSFAQVVGLNRNFLALTVNGAAYTWGDNQFGQLGNNTGGFGNKVSSPVAVVGGHTFTKIAAGTAHCLALKSNDTIWVWGRGDFGILGDNTLTSKSSPIQIATMSNVVGIGAGAFNSAALKR